MPKYNLLIARFPYGRKDEPDTTDWLVETILKLKRDERIGEIFHARFDDTPITMTRNRAVEVARKNRADYLLMLDNDMKPDAYLHSNRHRLACDPRARPFWDSSWEFLLKNRDVPAAVAAPYCGPPPHENVYVFQWANAQSQHPNPDHRLAQFGREEAARMGGISPVDALPTGLILYDVRCFDLGPPPYFYYEWTDGTESAKASTEDCAQTRDLAFAGGRLYCNWDAWTGHWKWKCVGKPEPITMEMVSARHQEAVRQRLSSREQLLILPAPEANGRPDHDKPRFPTPEEAALDLDILR